ncbi:putative LPS assembly protein LptD [Membranihabitans marinus]
MNFFAGFGQDTLIQNEEDSLSHTLDSLKSEKFSKIKISKDAFSSGVVYGADHKTYFDRKKNLVFLYGNAFVEYGLFSIKNADYIEVDLNTNIASARLLPDSLKHLIGNTVYDTIVPQVVEVDTLEDEYNDNLGFEDGQEIDPITGEIIENPDERKAEKVQSDGTLPGRLPGTPIFSDGQNEFDAKQMRYNFKTKKGKIYEAVTFQSNLYIHGREAKFIENLTETDTNQIIYNRGALFTTCDAPIPHFGVRSNKQKIIPNKEVIVGPSNLEIMGIPTPLVLPFGFYPIVPTAKAGLIIPSYEYSQTWGFGLRGLGYYTPISEHMNLTTKGDIYFNGSWLVDAQSSYNYRYRFSGGFSVSMSDRKSEVVGSIEKSSSRSFSFRWNHSQAQSAHPYQTFSASVNFSTNGFDKINSNQAERVLNNNTSSQISFSRQFPGTPFSLNGNISHSQNANVRSASFELPSVNVQMRSLQPFKRKNAGGSKEQWYEKILLTYNSKFKNKIQATDTTIFKPNEWKSQDYGVQHTASLSSSYRLFKYINVTPSINVNERWYFDRVDKQFESNPVIEFDTVFTEDGQSLITSDTVSYGSLVVDTLNEFNAIHGFSASLSLQTARYFTRQWEKGWFRGFRHVYKPSVSVSFTPDYQDWGYVDTVNVLNTRAEYEEVRYSPFENGIFGAPSTGKGNLSLNYSLRNVMEAKFFNKEDSTTNKISLFKTFDFSGNYNPYADSLKFSMINFSANTTFFKGITYFRLSAQFDPYATNDLGQRLGEFSYKTGSLLRFNGLSAGLSTNMTIAKIRELFSGGPEEGSGEKGGEKKEKQGSQSTGIFDNFRVSHEIRFVWDPSKDIDVFQLSTNNIRLSGNIDLTENWGVRVGNFGYDFERKQLTYPDFGFSRDIHCWELSFSWQPTRKTFLFNIRVKNAPLDFIDIPYNRGIQDSGYSPF